ncbi:YcfL family protein [Pasteurellaceae bacterium HPA106]|uniref:DUF1425 domain-containing protein n=1 Tax=Spirabiliibacterium pneumoniae TaxID=221400 RepID=UPI001AACC691|nr:YcfL family protein [Spirabiliibacterium pneumoniae]MBE2895381.1 YcfL family protein [Spirabiliibacterium pneumoniae]
MKNAILTALCLFLCACSSAPQRYLASDHPIVNVDAQVAAQTRVFAGNTQVELKNVTDQLLTLQYQITWYDANGVTQLADWAQTPPWLCVSLQGQSAVRIALHRPTPDSQNYRIYIMGKGRE